MAATEHHKMTKYLGRACSLWASSGQLQPSILELLKSHVEENSQYSNYGWLLLALVSGHVPLKVMYWLHERFISSAWIVYIIRNCIICFHKQSYLQDPQFVMEYFNNSIHTPEGVGLYTLLQVSKQLWLFELYHTFNIS